MGAQPLQCATGGLGLTRPTFRQGTVIVREPIRGLGVAKQPEHPLNSNAACGAWPGVSARRPASSRRMRRRCSSDQQPPPEHALERVPVAVALDAPALQGQIPVGLEMEVDAVTVGSQPGRGHRLITAALEMLG